MSGTGGLPRRPLSEGCNWFLAGSELLQVLMEQIDNLGGIPNLAGKSTAVYEFARPSQASHRWILKVEHEGCCSRVLLLQPCALIFRAVPQPVDDAASALDGSGWQARV